MSIVSSALTSYTTTGPYAYSIPSWCNKIDVIILGGGEAGTDGASGNGAGGLAGLWITVTLQRGVDIPWSTTQITGTVATGGATNGAPGAATIVTATGMTTLTALGGDGNAAITDVVGASPGNKLFNTQTYVGGVTQSSLNNAGNAPGGGGAGGGLFSAGGAGARGQAWFFAWVDETPSNFFKMYV